MKIMQSIGIDFFSTTILFVASSFFYATDVRNTIFFPAIDIALNARLLTHRSIFVGRIYGRPLSEIDTDFFFCVRNTCSVQQKSMFVRSFVVLFCSLCTAHYVRCDRFHKTCTNNRDSSFQFGYFPRCSNKTTTNRPFMINLPENKANERS